MKSTKLTKARLDEMIREEMEKVMLYEMYGIGLASSRPSFTQEREEQPKPPKKVYRKCKTLADIPKAYDPEDDGVVCLMDEDLDLRTEEQQVKDKLKDTVATFQRFYRSLDDANRYLFKKWLRSALIKELTFEEVNALVAKANASSKAMIEPQNKNEKPE